jgi:hypothetical protein
MLDTTPLLVYTGASQRGVWPILAQTGDGREDDEDRQSVQPAGSEPRRYPGPASAPGGGVGCLSAQFHH